MERIVFLAGLIALSSAQFPQPAFLDIPGVTPPPWRGPLADHINGLPPQDTPEVAAAKIALNQAYAQVLAVLPELPPEERYKANPEVTVPQYIPQYIPQYNQHLLHHVAPTQAPITSTIKTFAEEIPRSPIGEVPEVHAARVAHLKAVQDAASVLPRLADTYVQPTVNQVHPVVHHVQQPHHPGLGFQDYWRTQQPAAHQWVQDTPEVAKAKAEHAAAVAAALG